MYVSGYLTKRISKYLSLKALALSPCTGLYDIATRQHVSSSSVRMRGQLEKSELKIMKTIGSADLSHGNVIKAVRAVEDNTLDSKGLGEVLRRLCLTRSSRSLWRSIEVEMEGTHQRTITTISERRNHQPIHQQNNDTSFYISSKSHGNCSLSLSVSLSLPPTLSLPPYPSLLIPPFLPPYLSTPPFPPPPPPPPLPPFSLSLSLSLSLFLSLS